jgi:sterol 3beta-glucosyltransferase
MHVTFLALGSRGDIQPYAALGQGLRSAGHWVCFVTAENFGGMIAAYGLDFVPVPGDAEAVVRKAGANMLALVRSFGEMSKGIARDLDRLAPILGETDVIINQLPGGLYGYDLAQKYGVPLVMAAVIPLNRTSAFPMIGWPTLFASVVGYNRLSYRVAEQMAWHMLRPFINRWRQEKLGLLKLPFRGYFNELYERGVPVLNGFSRYVVPCPIDWGEHIHITGYWYPEDETWGPPDELCRFIEAGPPPVFIGFGSMPVSQPERTTNLILEALQQAGQRAVLHTGWAGLGGDLHDDVFQIEYAPYNWLFPRMAAVVHHGGSGTTASGLRAGVSTLIVPFLFDQSYWGRRVAALGAGPAPIPYKQLSVDRLAEGITRAVNDTAMRQRAASLGQKIRAEDGIAQARQIIEDTVQKGYLDNV